MGLNSAKCSETLAQTATPTNAPPLSSLQHSVIGQPTVLVCEGKHCSSKGSSELGKDLRKCAEVKMVRCQNICEGPVVGFEIGGYLTWFSKIRSKRTKRALIDAVQTGRIRRRIAAKIAKRKRDRLR
jgi:hypothetical protein